MVLSCRLQDVAVFTARDGDLKSRVSGYKILKLKFPIMELIVVNVHIAYHRNTNCETARGNQGILKSLVRMK